MEDVAYLMESEEESIRLEAKTDPAVVEQQALWAQIRPGMRVADLGCGCGKTTPYSMGSSSPGVRLSAWTFRKKGSNLRRTTTHGRVSNLFAATYGDR